MIYKKCPQLIILIGLIDLFLLQGIGARETSDGPIVRTSYGYIKGYYKTSYNGRKFRAFEGIPYAMPPVGKLRFEPPMAMFPWEGIAYTASHGAMCMQYSQFPSNPNNPVEGSEDCLYINVYAPEQTDSSELLPILFFIHGGGFQTSSGNHYGPRYLLDRDVILVTFNYRLGPLGFLSTEDSIVPGNMGLKDQGLALRWTSQNAHEFGGDKTRITIVGQGAGAASVHYHFQSHWSKGYFQRAISASGTALHSWALTEAPLQKVMKIAETIGCLTGNTQTTVECIQHRPANQIVRTVGDFQPFQYNPFAVFGPVVEKGGRYPFIEYEPIIAFTEGKASDIPWLTGVVSHEGLYSTAAFITNNTLLKEVNDNWDHVAPFLLDFNYTVPLEQQPVIARKIKEFYVKDKPFDATKIKQIIDMANDRLYFRDADYAVKVHAKFNMAPVWFYYFSYRGSHSFSEILSATDQNLGVCHLDDVLYIFDTPYKDMGITLEDFSMRQKLIDMWVSFATNGMPSMDVAWDPLDRFKENLHYLHIAHPDIIHMEHYRHLGEKLFWDGINLYENRAYPSL